LPGFPIAIDTEDAEGVVMATKSSGFGFVLVATFSFYS
jgi:hypothetical protein